MNLTPACDAASCEMDHSNDNCMEDDNGSRSSARRLSRRRGVCVFPPPSASSRLNIAVHSTSLAAFAIHGTRSERIFIHSWGATPTQAAFIALVLLFSNACRQRYLPPHVLDGFWQTSKNEMFEQILYSAENIKSKNLTKIKFFKNIFCHFEVINIFMKNLCFRNTLYISLGVKTANIKRRSKRRVKSNIEINIFFFCAQTIFLSSFPSIS